MGEQSEHLTLNIHLVKGQVYWVVMRRLKGHQVMLAKGVVSDPYPAEEHLYGSLLMEAAYAAYRWL